MAVRDGRGDVKQTTTGFRVLLMVQSLTSAKSKFLSLRLLSRSHLRIILVMQGYLLEEILHCCRSYRIILFFIVCVATCH